MSRTERVVEFFFSFRSPYCWLTFKALPPLVEACGFEIRYYPVYPPEFDIIMELAPDVVDKLMRLEDPAENPDKLSYIFEDMERLAAEHNLPFYRPRRDDLDWQPSHGTFFSAVDRGREIIFGEKVFEARFVRDLDISDRAVLAQLIEQCGMNADEVMREIDTPAWRHRLAAALHRFIEVGGFGVPLAVVGGKRFWGQDRLPQLEFELQGREEGDAHDDGSDRRPA